MKPSRKLSRTLLSSATVRLLLEGRCQELGHSRVGGDRGSFIVLQLMPEYVAGVGADGFHVEGVMRAGEHDDPLRRTAVVRHGGHFPTVRCRRMSAPAVEALAL